MSEEAYQEILRRTLGEELAAQCNLPYPERVKSIAEDNDSSTLLKTKSGRLKDIPDPICHSAFALHAFPELIPFFAMT